MPRAWLGMPLNPQRVCPLAFMSTMLPPMAFKKKKFFYLLLLSILSFNLVKVHNYFLNFIGVLIHGSLHPYRHSILC